MDWDHILVNEFFNSPEESGYDSTGSLTEASPGPLNDAREFYNSYGHEIGPHLEVTVQPQKQYRFRYLTEFKDNPHGPLQGVNSTKANKVYPTVKLNNYTKKAVIRCWLYDSVSKQAHIHQLLTKNDGKGIRSEPHDYIVDVTNNFTAPFEGLNIIHAVTKGKDYLQSFHKKQSHIKSGFDLKKEIVSYNETSLKQEVKRIDKNKAVLYFEAFDYKTKERLCDCFSWEIRNSKNPNTSPLKIARQSIDCGWVNGGTEVYIFVEKVPKDVKVIFSDELVAWSAEAKIEEIWHQLAIVFRTPAYTDINITEKRKVSFKLIRESDGSVSNDMAFFYLPDCKNQINYCEPVIVGKKRRIGDDSGNIETTLANSFAFKEDYSTEPSFCSSQGQLINNPFINAGMIDEDNLVFSDNYELDLPLNVETEDFSVLELPEGIECDSLDVDSESFQLIPDIPKDKDTVKNVTPQTRDDSYLCAKNILKMVSNNGEINLILFEETLKKMESLNLRVKDIRNPFNKTLLHMAIENRNTEYVKSILLSGVEIDATDIDRNSALHLAVANDTEDDVINLLLSRGAKTSLSNNAGETPIHLACRLGKNSALQCLLAHIETYSKYHSPKTGDTPLHVAVRYKHIELMRSLLEKVPVDSLNYAYLTPLHIAVLNESVDLVKLILSYMNPEVKKNLYLVNVMLTKIESDSIFELFEDYLERAGYGMADIDSYDVEFSANLSSDFTSKCKLEESST